MENRIYRKKVAQPKVKLKILLIPYSKSEAHDTQAWFAQQTTDVKNRLEIDQLTEILCQSLIKRQSSFAQTWVLNEIFKNFCVGK